MNAEKIRSIVFRYADLALAGALALASFLLYLRTLAPDVVDADGGEFQFAAWNFGFVHPTGYPLYLILGGLFQHLVPIGNPAYRLNLFTAITAALAIAVLFFAVKETTQNRAAALIAAASFGVTRTFWYDASAAETYDLNAFFVALLIYIALRWQSSPTVKTFAVFCFAYGLALTHHRTIILWLPAFALFFILIFLQNRLRTTFHTSRSTLNFLLLAFSFLLPVLLYLYIPLRAPTSPYATLALAPGQNIVLYDNSPSGFLNYILGRTFQSEIGWDAVSVARLASVSQLLFDQFGVVGVVLGGIGWLVMMVRREWARLAMLFTGFAMTILFASFYHIGDIFHYYIPAYLVWAIGIGYGINGLLTAIRDTQQAICSLQFAVGIVIALILLMPQISTNFGFVDRSYESQPRELWTRVLSEPIPQNAILISNDRDEMMPLWYIQYVENTRRDILALFPIITPSSQHTNIGRLTDSVFDAGRPIFFIKPMPGIEIKYRVEKSNLLWRVLGRTADVPPQFTSDAVLGGRVRVIGYDFARDAGGARVAIYWSPAAKVDGNYTTFVHLFDTKGNKIAQGNDHQVGGEFYPTSLWSVGEILRDEHTISLPPRLAPGKYRLRVGMYRSSDSEVLGEPVVIGEIEVK